MSAVDLPAELVAYMVWTIGAIEETNHRIQVLLEQIAVNVSRIPANTPGCTHAGAARTALRTRFRVPLGA